MELLTDTEIAQRLAALRSGGVEATETSAGASPAFTTPHESYIHPLSDAAESLIEALRMDEGIGLGLLEIDVLTRGFRPTDLVIISGFAAAGKTQVANTLVLNNRNKRILFLSLDDPVEMILAKLTAMHTGVSAEQLERQVREGDPTAQEIIREAATTVFPNLLVVDQVIGLSAMQVAVREASEHWGAPPQAVILDYLEMMPGDGRTDDAISNVKNKANSLKRWAKEATDFPLIALHQGTRSNARPGEPITMLSLGYSGEQQATVILGVRRKRFLADLDVFDRARHENTITIHICKNKHPGGRITHYQGVDFYMNPETGFVRALTEHERAAGNRQQTASERAGLAERLGRQTALSLGDVEHQRKGDAS